ncbi:unnamed protein product [Adineta ricciae]|uniref:G-protein coupled receptors family 1 profile domain-containing protein n=1 Tax=Adineta ricciae TaxID=249248 RepID=A0A816C3J3_ADIRI|nr:unnamed protein product [Adineta ricciae]CAF1617856.1 unnamed protein product [Adineta ricciae]
MSSAVVTSLVDSYRQVFIYMGIPILSFGLVGGIFNILVFLSLQTFRQSSCASYLTVMSLLNLGQLITGLLSRILITGYDIDFTRTSLFYCKFRLFFLQVSTGSSLGCICLATIDQYFATCARPRWQQWCNIHVSRRILLGLIVIFVIEQSPCMIVYDHRMLSVTSNETICVSTSIDFDKFNIYFNSVVLANVIPLTITSTFGVLIYRNIQQLSYRTVPFVRQELDKQLNSMVLILIFCINMMLLPQLIVYFIVVYGNIQDSRARAQLNLAYAITLCLYYLFFASPFYIYMIVSERFRRQFVYVIFQMHINRYRPQRVAPNVIFNLT